MAYELKSVFEVQDRASSTIRRITQRVQQLNTEMERLNRTTQRLNGQFNSQTSGFNRATNVINRHTNTINRNTTTINNNSSSVVHNTTVINRNSSAVSRASSSLSGLTGMLAGVAAAYLSVQGAAKIFNATVGEAMKMQQSQIVIGAMFDDKDLADQYMKMLDKVSIDSPVLNSQGMYANSKSFITASKDINQLEKMWDLAERLVAIDPVQGLDGAVVALRELFSGDAVSMVERFEMSRTAMKEIKNLPLDQQLKKLDEYFNKIGLTTRVIEDMGGSALGMWSQVQERFALVLRDMGEPSLRAVSEFLNGVLDRLEGEPMQKFAEWGGKVINSMVTGLSNSAIRIYDWFTQLTSSPEFQSKTTLTGKINFVVEDIAQRLREWFDGGGKDKIINFGSDVAQILVSAMDATPEVFELGARLGDAIWQGIIDGVKKSAAESPIGKYINAVAPVFKYGNPVTGLLNVAKDAVKYSGGQASSHYHGLSSVPYDGYSANLHKGERVLTAQENKEYSEGKGGFGGGIQISMNGVTIREEADIHKLATTLANELERKAMQRG